MHARGMIAVLMGVFLALGAGAVPIVWAESSLQIILPDARPTRTSPEAIRLYAAKGERESFQVCIHGTRSNRRVVAVSASVHPFLAEPEISRVGFVALPESSPRAAGRAPLWPDRLLPLAPFTVPRDETRSLWVSYYIPRSAPAGIHTTALQVQLEPGRTYTIEVVIEVFDFTLPELPSYRTLLAMDWRRLAECSPEMDGPALADNTYRRLAPYRIAYNPYIDEPAPALGRARPLDATALQRSLSRANALGQFAVLDLGAAQPLASRWPRPQFTGEPDRLTPFMEEMAAWLTPRGWNPRAVVQPALMAPRPDWDELRDEYRRVRAASRDVARVVRAPFHPFFERLAEIWAVPYGAYNPAAHDRLARGFSLDNGLAAPAVSVMASSWAAPPGAPGFPGAPRDGYDGSRFTAWYPSQPPRPGAPQWFEVVLAEAVQTDTLTIHWPAGFEGAAISVRTSFDGRAFSTATVDWQHEWSVLPFETTRSRGRFRLEKQLRAIRIAIERPARGPSIGIVDITFGTPPVAREPQLVTAPEVWFTPGGDFPAVTPDAIAFEARLFPWISWAWGVRGLADLPLSAWPGALMLPDNAGAEVLAWPGYAPPLLYPAANGWHPSLRLERLRDGIEDYEFLIRAGRIADSDGPMAAEFAEALPEVAWLDEPDLERVAAFAARALETRVRIGRMLSRHGGANTKEESE